jgi:Spy/CpxP family protein refolding chaperone
MSMKSFIRSTLAVSAATIFSAVCLLAQGPGAGHFGRGGNHFLATALDMTDAQQAQMKTIRANERAASKPIMQQLRTQREAVEAAIQSGQSAEQVAELAAQQGALLGQLEGIRASARQQLFSILTPAQQKKMLAMRPQRGQRGQGAPGGPPATE